MVSPAITKRPSIPSSHMVTPKRQKTKDSSTNGGDTIIHRSELDSALALAALALDSPSSRSRVADQERQESSNGCNKRNSRLSTRQTDVNTDDVEQQEDETRGPSSTEEPAPVTPKHSPSKLSSRRGQFTSSREENEDDEGGTAIPHPPVITPSPSSRLARKRRPMVIPPHHRNGPPPHPSLHHPPLHHPHHRLPPPSPFNRSAAHLYHRVPPHPPLHHHRHHIPPPLIGYHPHHPAAAAAAHHAAVTPPYHPAHHQWGHPPPPPHHAAAAYHHRVSLVGGPPPLSPMASRPSAAATKIASTATVNSSAKSCATQKKNSTINKKANNNDWICDYCNEASFSSYEEACAHEDICKHKYTTKQQGRNPDNNTRTASTTTTTSTALATTTSTANSSRSDQDGDTRDAIDYHAGCIPLAVESADSEWLSELNCYLRKHCIEAFSATPADILKTSKRGRIVLNQVGIRCQFCKHQPMCEKAVAAVSYPTSLGGIYESVKRWQRVHLPACRHVPEEAQAQLDAMRKDTSWVPTTRQYWTDAARALGMVDTPEGIRFEREPSSPNWMPKAMSSTTNDHLEEEQQKQKREISSSTASSMPLTCTKVPNTAMTNTATTSSSSAKEESATMQQQHRQLSSLSSNSGGYICFPEDQAMIPPYVYFLMRQVEPCYFTEADRFVARSKGPVGFAGFQCRHCQGHAGLGKYFPHHSKALSTNSTSQNIHAHILKCRKTNPAIKEELVYLKNEKMKSPRLVPGWRKTFFERVWERLHGDQVNI